MTALLILCCSLGVLGCTAPHPTAADATPSRHSRAAPPASMLPNTALKPPSAPPPPDGTEPPAPLGDTTGTAPPALSSPSPASPPQALVHTIGRYDDSDPQRPIFSWPGTSLHTRIRTHGAGLAVRLKAPKGIYFNVIFDGEPHHVLATRAGAHRYELAPTLSAGTHDVILYRRNEGAAGNVQLLSFEPQEGATLVSSPVPFQRKLEFIGDSITCGYGVEGKPGCSFSAATESAYLSYAAIAARNLNAQAHLIAYSGKGLVQNWGGERNRPMPSLYGRTLTSDGTKAWDFSRYTPDAVIINLGTNDFSAPITRDVFVRAYRALLERVRRHYPKATLFAVRWSHWGAAGEAYIREAVRLFADDNTRELRFALHPGEGHGCDKHPSAASHARLGAELTQALREALGW